MKTSCEVCGNDLVLEKEHVYTAIENKGLSAAFSPNTLYDVTDCPKCGCQNILHARLPKVEETEVEPDEDEATGNREKTPELEQGAENGEGVPNEE